ncbi:hypothetical protein LSTR_LSTR000145 [Laodelphax striatellus]|uniref:Uncharacterized protein n=1 Tax=Laodelphax striatellus TaxID=195883 RepID=A0A482X7Z3_LAOST|nr:hypothetical protein LSTR_LSTR000145 [Laodelphax striatellus]
MFKNLAFICYFITSIQVIYSSNGEEHDLVEIPIGGLLHSMNDEDELSAINEKAFHYAVDLVNNDPDTLAEFKLKALTQRVKEHNSFNVGSKVCELLSKGVAGIFGPQSQLSSLHVQSICDAMEIPHIELRFDALQRRGSCLVNLYPHPSELSKVYADLVRMSHWKSFTVIYEDNDGLMRLNKLLTFYDKKGYPVTVRQLSSDDNHRPILRRVKNAGETFIVLDCSIGKLYSVLEQAMQVGLMGDDINYIVTNLDMQTIDLSPFMHGGTNITGLRMFDPEDEDVKEVLDNWKECPKNSKDGEDCAPVIGPDSQVHLETILVMDAVFLFAVALQHLSNTMDFAVTPLNCSEDRSWDHGYSIINFMKVSELKGLSGLIKFDHQGFRTNFKLDIIELTSTGLRKKGSWNTTEGVNLTAIASGSSGDQGAEDLRNMTFIVLTALTHPYGMLKETSHKLTGNERFEGFGIDLIHELSLKCGFNYTFRLQPDKSSGNPNPKTGKWNGMIGEVLAGRADLAIADITITREREQDADFTMPFMNLGISLLYKKPMKEPPSLFSFLSPFSYEVWGYMIAAYIGVSILLFFMARISPAEWTNPYPCIEEPDNLENQFSLNNSLWFTIGSLMQQGSEIAPIAISTRLTASIWWFFTLIMVSSYTANLAAFLTVETSYSPIRNVEDLANHKTIRYGAKAGGSTANFFRDSNHSTYQKMWQFMKENPSVMTSSNEEGVRRVNDPDEDYAFLMESTSIEYEVERKCELSQIGGLLDNKGYGIVMRKNSPYRNALSTSVISLQETGKLTKLKNKWWKEKRGGGACQTKDDSAGAASELGLENVGGVFVVLVCGVFVACFVALGELFYDVSTKEERGPLREELMQELRFITRCRGSTKPVRKAGSEEEEDEEEEETNNDVTSEMPLGPFSTPYRSFDTNSKQPL